MQLAQREIVDLVGKGRLSAETFRPLDLRQDLAEMADYHQIPARMGL